MIPRLEQLAINTVAAHLEIFPSLEHLPLHIADAIVERLCHIRSLDLPALR